MSLRSLLRSYLRRSDGAISVVAAIVIPVLVGALALVGEYGYGLITKAEAQRTSDLSAYAGALAYKANGTTASMQLASAYLAGLNGFASQHVTTSLVGSPRTSGSNAVSVAIQAQQPLLLAPVIGGSDQMTVRSGAFAQLSQDNAACIIALDSAGTGVTLTGGTRVTAQKCAVSSNVSLSVPCGTTLSARGITYNTSLPSQPCNGISSSAGMTKKLTSDPLASEAAVTAARSRIATAAALNAPTVTTTSDLKLDWNSTSLSQGGCTGTRSNAIWTVTCPAGVHNLGAISVGGGITATVTVTGSGANTFNIAKSTASCGSSSGYSLCNTGTSLTFSGSSTFVLAGGIYNGGGATLVVGSGTGNSFKVGPGADGHAINNTGAKLVLADATGSSSVFQMAGNIYSSGGTCTTLSAASQHDVKGYLSGGGGMILGAGVYTVNGYIAFGANWGGDVSCNGSTVGVSGSGVTLVTAGASTASGACPSSAFCIAAGYRTVTLTAPTAGNTAKLVVVGPASASNTAGATFAGGASGTSMSGALYFPNGPVALTGGASLGDVPGGCLQIIGSNVTLSGGTAAASSCFSSGGASAVVLVQ